MTAEATDSGSSREDGPPRGAVARVSDFFKQRYLAADPRWLGVFRICLGTLLCVEVLRRWYYAKAFYTNEGFLPNHYSLFRPMGRNVFSIYHAFSTYGEICVAFALTLVVFVLFTIGYRTRLFHVIAAVCITSLNARNIFVENGGTIVVNIITVLTAFLPLGSRFSVDAVRRSLRERRERSAEELNDRSSPVRATSRVYSLVMLTLMLQWSVIYFFNTVHKDGMGWKDGTALHWFLQQDRIVTGFAIWARENVPLSVLKTLTWGTLVVEGGLSLLILFPFWQTWTRRIVLICIWGLHGFIALSARLGPFSYVMSMFPILLLGDRDWQLVARWFGKPTRARIIFYEASCAACLGVCRFLKRLDPFDRLTFVDSMDELPEAVRDRAKKMTLATVDPEAGTIRTGHLGLYDALRALPFGIVFAIWLRVPGVSGIASWACRRFVARRERIADAFALPDPGAPVPAGAEESPLRKDLRDAVGVVREGVVAVLLVALGAQVLTSNPFVSKRVRIQRPLWMVQLVEYPRMLQGWLMFAPEPPYEDGRIVVDGRTIDGRKLDPFTGKEPEFDPHAPNGWGHEQFICDYHNRIRFPGHTGNRQHFKAWLLRQHEHSGKKEDRLIAFDVWWVQDKSPPPGQERGEPLPPQKLFSHGRVADSGALPWLKKPVPPTAVGRR